MIGGVQELTFYRLPSRRCCKGRLACCELGSRLLRCSCRSTRIPVRLPMHCRCMSIAHKLGHTAVLLLLRICKADCCSLEDILGSGRGNGQLYMSSG